MIVAISLLKIVMLWECLLVEALRVQFIFIAMCKLHSGRSSSYTMNRLMTLFPAFYTSCAISYTLIITEDL